MSNSEPIGATTQTTRLPLETIYQGRDYCFRTTKNIRSYEWGTKETEELWDDLTDMALKSGDEYYELQQIVLTKADWDKGQFGTGALYDVHDGQQRLVTLSLIFAALRDSFKGDESMKDEEKENAVEELSDMLNPTKNRKEDILRIEVRHKEGQMLRSILSSEVGSTINLPSTKERKQEHRTDQRVISNYELLLKNSFSLEGEDRLKILDYLKENVFMLVCVPEDSRMARNLVMGQGKGKNNEPIDDFKGQVCFRETEAERDQEDIFEKWDKLAESAGRDTVADACIRLASAHLRKRVKKNEEVNILDEWLKHDMKEQGYSYDGKQFFHEKVKAGSEKLNTFRAAPPRDLLAPYMRGEREDSDLIRSISARLMLFSRISNSKLLCNVEVELVVLHQLTQNLSLEELERTFKLFEPITLWMLLTKPSPVARHRRCFEFLDYISTDGNRRKSGTLINKEESGQIKNILKSSNFGSTPSGKKTAMALLERLNAHELSTESQSDIFKCTHLQIEHILPQKPVGEYWTKYWTDESSRGAWTHRLGNLAILNQKANAKASNKSFSTKKDHYLKSPYPLTSSLHSVDVWDMDATEENHMKLVHLANEIWGL